MTTRLRPNRAGERGAVLVEFAIVAPLLVLLLLGIADLGLIVHQHQVLQNAAREGARFSALPLNSAELAGCPAPYTAGSCPQIALVQQRVVNYCLQENVVVTAANVTVDQQYPITAGGETVYGSRVNVTYSASSLFPGLGLGSVTLNGFSVFRNLY